MITSATEGTLAEHYGFTSEELDFIINYDLKYRMGQDAADSDAGDNDSDSEDGG
jgi:hypothetical protein